MWEEIETVSSCRDLWSPFFPLSLIIHSTAVYVYILGVQEVHMEKESQEWGAHEWEESGQTHKARARRDQVVSGHPECKPEDRFLCLSCLRDLPWHSGISKSMLNTFNANPVPVTTMHAWKGPVRYQINYCIKVPSVAVILVRLIPIYLSVRNGIISLTQLLLG